MNETIFYLLEIDAHLWRHWKGKQKKVKKEKTEMLPIQSCILKTKYLSHVLSGAYPGSVTLGK